MDFIDYRKKLGIGFDNEELENLFFHRMWNLIDDDQYMKCQMSIREYYNYCMEIIEKKFSQQNKVLGNIEKFA